MAKTTFLTHPTRLVLENDNSEFKYVKKETGKVSTIISRKSWKFSDNEGKEFVESHECLYPQESWHLNKKIHSIVKYILYGSDWNFCCRQIMKQPFKMNKTFCYIQRRSYQKEFLLKYVD